MSVKYTSYEKQAMSTIDKSLLAGLSAVGAFVEGNAAMLITENQNVDTGRLRGSITYSIDGKTSRVNSFNKKDKAAQSDAVPRQDSIATVSIGSNVEYAEFIEYAIRGKAKPFLRPAVDNNRAVIGQILTNEVRKRS